MDGLELTRPSLQITVLNTNDDPVFSGDTIVETAATEDSCILEFNWSGMPPILMETA